MSKKYRELIDPLISYTCRVKDVDPRKLGYVRLIYEVMREAIADLHQTSSKHLKQDAQDYFNSDVFVYHCKSVFIPTQLMRTIALNPDDYINFVAEEGAEDESYSEFSDVP